MAGDAFGTQPVVAIQDAGGNHVRRNQHGVAGHRHQPVGRDPLGLHRARPRAASPPSAAARSTSPGTATRSWRPTGRCSPARATPFNIVTAALTSFKVTPATNNPTAGTAFNVTITGLDQSGFMFPGLTGTQTIAFSGPSNSPNGTAPLYPATVNFSGGVGTASVTLYDAQTTQLTATQGSVSGTSGNITVSRSRHAGLLHGGEPGHPDGRHSVQRDDHRRRPVRQRGDGLHEGNHTLTFTGPAQRAEREGPELSGPGQLHQRRGHGEHHPLRRPACTTLKATATGPNLTGTSTTSPSTRGPLARSR